MSSFPQWVFGPFRLDIHRACVWSETQAIALAPKSFAVLHYLVTHPDRVITKDELLDAVWPETAVSEAVLRVTIGTLRQVLSDPVQTPRYIATVPRRGYRFLAPVTRTDAATPSVVSPMPMSPLDPTPPPLLVERDTILQRLTEAWAQARQGRRQVIFLTGEAGIGKTAVVEAWAAQVRPDPTACLAYGQCVEHYGASEAYLPVLEALGQLCRTPSGARLVALLRQQAPSWLVQLPWLLTEADRHHWRYELQGTTRARMLREFADVVETFTAETPLVLVLEDLHWSDYTTLDLLALLARRQLPARLLLLGTYRPVDILVREHPLYALAQELRQHQHSTEIPLALLSPAAVVAYLVARCPGHAFPATLASWLHAHTEGNPLFLVTLVRALVERGVLAEQDGGWMMQGGLDALTDEIPETLRQWLEHQFARVPPDAQRVLEVASVAGSAFATALVAAGIGENVLAVERHCEALAQRHLLRPGGLVTWPDGTIATRYEFTHALYQQVAYARLGPGHRAQLHQRLGICLEAAYGPRAEEISAELAEHFARGHDVRRAVHYLLQAAENAARRSAQSEIIALLTRALALLKPLPETPDRLQQELDIHMALVPAWRALKGYVAPEVEQTCARAHALCQQVGTISQLFLALHGMWWYAQVAGALQTAQTLAAQLLQLAKSSDDSAHLLVAYWALSRTSASRGELVSAREYTQHGTALYNRQQHGMLAWPMALTLG